MLQIAAVVALIWLAALTPAAVLAQAPISLEEQIRRFNSLPADQQQTLIRQLETTLPPGEREALLNQLRLNPSASVTTDATRADAMPPELGLSYPMEPEAPLGPTRLKGGDTLVIEFDLPSEEDEPPISAEERRRLEEVQERLAYANPYQLDSSGMLYLPGVPAIQLSGLDPEQARVRIRAEPSVRPFDVTLTHLPLEPVGPAALEPFGYDVFSGAPQRFAASTNIPVPSDYVIGPGDEVNIQLFGNQNQQHFLTVSRDGTINLPQIGPITVNGLTINGLRTAINDRVDRQLTGVQANTTLGELRSIQVFVVGDVERPGAYTVSALATITSALYASGGIEEIGSLRNIELMRDGQLVTELDLYELLWNGDTSNDSRLQDGDAILVRPIGATVAVDGEVRRPAIYELSGESTIAELVRLAGGLNPSANRSAVKLERIVPGRGTTVRDIDLDAAGGSTNVENGDVVRVQPNLDLLEGSVRLAGNVFRPGVYEWREGMTVGDLLPSPELVKPLSDLNYVLIRREGRPNVDVDVLSADLQAIWQGRPGAVDLELQPRDTVVVFNLEIGRQHVIQPLMEVMRAQAPTHQPMRTVSVGGQVRAPGQYPLEAGMQISDLLRAGGGLTPSAYAIEAELTRYDVVNGEYRETEVLVVDLAAVLNGDAAEDVFLAPYDHLTVKEVSRWREQQTIQVAGEAQFPGEYPIRQGETLSSVLERAGGLTDLAFPDGAVFTRVHLRERQSEQLETLARRIESDLAAVALSDPASADVISTGETLIRQLRNSEAVGRTVIDLAAIVANEATADIVLRDGDQLFIPPITQEVMVLGEVQYATSHLYAEGLSRDDYIDMSGGMTSRADEKRIYVVRANGSVVSEPKRRWFRRSAGSDMQPGDTVVVPLDTDRVRPLAAWESITQVLYNIAIAFSVIDGL